MPKPASTRPAYKMLTCIYLCRTLLFFAPYADFSFKNNDYDLRLVYELMQQIDFPLKDHQRYWISEYSQLTISIPKDREEQTAIATILTDMDKEIADLEAKRDKYSLLKSGMMQKLLTGQIRLKINRI